MEKPLTPELVGAQLLDMINYDTVQDLRNKTQVFQCQRTGAVSVMPREEYEQILQPVVKWLEFLPYVPRPLSGEVSKAIFAAFITNLAEKLAK